MRSLRIEVDGRVLTFDDSRPLTIGRAGSADVVLPAMSVSRAHAELRPSPGGWLLVDGGGQGGTFVGGQRVSQLTLTGTTVVQCGPDGPGSRLTVVVESQAPPPAPAPPPYAGTPAPPPYAGTPAPPPYAGTQPPPAPPAQPAFAPPTAPTPAAPAAPPSPFAPPGAGAPPAPATPGPAAYDPPAPDAADAGLGFEPTYVLAGPVPGAFPGQLQPRSGPDLLVEVDGQEYRYRHPDQVTIGRLPDSSIVIADPVASRMHLRVDATAGGWGFTNLSREGTFVAGRRVESETFDDQVVVRLGHPTAGPELRLVPVLSSAEEQARFARKRRRKVLGGVGAGVLALVLVGALVGGSIALFGGDDDPAPTAAADTAALLDRAKAKTVRISYEVETYDGQSGLVTGSGSIISADGLILTNAHVADPQAEGLDEIYGEAPPFDSPEYVDISLTDPDEDFRIGDPSFRARVVESDGDSDAAVVEIYADADGDEVDPADLDLPFYDVGSSDDLATGDSITVLGFPGIASLSDIDPLEARPEVTVTTGVISTFIDTDRLGERSEIDTDARISQGNSGGSAVNADFELIGVPSATVSTEDAAGSSGRIRPIGVLADLISTSVEESGRD